MTYFGDYDASPGARLLRTVMRSFRIGSAFGVEVRMYWAAVLLLPLLMASWTAPFASSAGETWALVAIHFLSLFAIIWSHEMGHVAMGWRHGIQTPLITLGPLGGIAHMNAPASGPKQELQIALAGPAVHLLWLAIFWPLKALLPTGLLQPTGWWHSPIDHALWFLVTTNVSLLLFNLLPIFPLDGGRVARALLALRWHANRVTLWVTTAGIAGAVVLIAVGIARPRLHGAINLVIGLTCIQACLHERRIARYALVYGDAFEQPWQSDPDAWKRGGTTTEARPQRRQWLAGITAWRARRAAERAARERQAQRDLELEVDRVLARLHKVGRGGLSESELAVLQRASEQRRRLG